MSDTEQRWTVGVFGHYGNRNLGDEAITEAVVRALPIHAPRVRLVAFSIDPADTAERYGIPAYPVRRTARSGPSRPGIDPGIVRTAPMAEEAGSPTPAASGVRGLAKRIPFARAFARAARTVPAAWSNLRAELRFIRDARHWLRELDVLMVTGSNQFLDNFGGPWSYPYTLLKWTLLARLAGVSVIFVSVGAGPLDHPLSKAMVRTALRFAHYISYRDAASRDLVETRPLRGRGLVYPDLAHALPRSLVQGNPVHVEATAHLTIALNPMPVYDHRYWPDKSEQRYRRYVEALAELARRCRADGHRVILYGTQPSDERVIRDVLASLDDSTDIERRESRVLAELVDVIHEADVIVSTRFHGALLALACGRPVLALCYYRKTVDLMREMGLEDYAVVFEDAEAGDLHARLQRLIAERVDILERIARVDECYRAALAEQFERIAAMAPGNAAATTARLARGERNA